MNKELIFDRYQIEQAIEHLESEVIPRSSPSARNAIMCLVYNYRREVELAKTLSELAKKQSNKIFELNHKP